MALVREICLVMLSSTESRAPTGLYERWLLWFGAFLVIVVSGVRFSDGNMLLAIAREASISDPVFHTASAQYVWDSPLKILMLRAIPDNVVIIGAAFLALALMPAAGLLTTSRRWLWAAAVMIFLTPAFKISLQHVGQGDGLIFAATLVTCCSRSVPIVSTALLVTALWHPQQSFFIAVSFMLGRHYYLGGLTRRDIWPVAFALGVGAAIFFTYKQALGFTYSDRSAYMLANASSFLVPNLIYAPISLAPLALWLFVAGPKLQGSMWPLALWLAVLAVISLLTTDVTRVLTLISLPIVVQGALKQFDEGDGQIWTRKNVICAVLVALTPAYSWSGLDLFIWPSLVEDLCKWKLACG